MTTGIEILVSNRTDIDVDLDAVVDIGRQALAELGYDRGELGISFVELDEIARLNHDHLGREGATDVIAFPLDDSPGEADDPQVPLLLGDVVISPEVAGDNCREYGTSLSGEICRLVVHGILHVAGFDHERDDGVMAARQEKLIGALCGKQRGGVSCPEEGE